MIEIYNKINNHQVLDREDIKRFVFIKSLGKDSVEFSKENNDSYMYYDSLKRKVVVSKNAKSTDLKTIFSYSDIVLKDSEVLKNPFFLVDFYNISLICDLFHELEHAIQFEDIKKILTFKTKLIKDNYIFSGFSPQLYQKNHDLYYFEHDALIKSLIKTLKFIKNNCKNLNEEAILEFNAIMSGVIYHTYGNRYNYDDVPAIYESFNSPIAYTKFLSDCYHTDKERKILSICINNLEKESVTQYLKLLNGFELSDDVMNLILKVFEKDIRTTDVLEEIKTLDKQKIKTK